jgi:tRNA(Ile)-lysidine synthase
MGQLLGPDFPGDIALAVSGGGDSMAMLTLAHNWTRACGVRLWVVTVDHGLRPEAAEEAAMVAGECAALGWPHATLRWHGDCAGNLQDAARRGRLSVIDRWREGLAHVLFAHTRDDLAETFVMRLARGSGVEGLSAMGDSVAVRPHAGAPPPMPAVDVCWTARPPAATGPANGYRVLRPCLDMTRAELRHYLRTLKGDWVEDPSNDDARFSRARVRQARPALESLGLDAPTLAATARRIARARDALRARAAQVWSVIGGEGRAAGAPTGEILMGRAGFEATERDTQMRLLAAALQYVASARYRPRGDPLEALLDRLLGGGGGTLHGCEARMEADRLRVFREYAAVRSCVAPPGSAWDARWRTALPEGENPAGVSVRALGDAGLRQVADRPPDGPSWRSARGLPALWRGETLLACDAVGVGPGATSRLAPDGPAGQGFAAFLLSH